VVRKITDKKIRASSPSENPAADLPGSRQLEGFTVIEQSPGKAALEFSVPASSGYFDDHFPALKILPAVAQFELALRFAGRCLGTPLRVEKARRLKFSSLVRPGTPLRMELAFEEEGRVLSFTIASPDGTKTYSSGSCVLEGGAP
jgi:3-hydroxymyristoyl/3-hydroxydecanoyl-(acyl carrier protein) dehydratase